MNYEPLFIKTYQDKKVFLTGHTGFKGSWLLTWLHSLGAIVKGLALAPENKTDRLVYMLGLENYLNDWVVFRLGYQNNNVLA